MLRLVKPFRDQETFIIPLFSIVQIQVLRVKHFYIVNFVDILPLGYGSMDPHIFPDRGSQNFADPTECCKWEKLPRAPVFTS